MKKFKSRGYEEVLLYLTLTGSFAGREGATVGSQQSCLPKCFVMEGALELRQVKGQSEVKLKLHTRSGEVELVARAMAVWVSRHDVATK